MSDRILSRELVNEWRELGPVVIREEDVYQSHEALRERVEELEQAEADALGTYADDIGKREERLRELEAERDKWKREAEVHFAATKDMAYDIIQLEAEVERLQGTTTLRRFTSGKCSRAEALREEGHG